VDGCGGRGFGVTCCELLALLCDQGSCVAIEAQQTEGLRVTGADQESSRTPLEATSDLLRHETGRLSREEWRIKRMKRIWRSIHIKRMDRARVVHLRHPRMQQGQELPPSSPQDSDLGLRSPYSASAYVGLEGMQRTCV
jgi:hypothetical protein